MDKRSPSQCFSQDIIPNFDETASDYAKYRQGFPEEFFHRLIEKNFCDYDARVLDLGCGTGTIARGMAQLGFETYALDPAEKLIEEAKHLDEMINVKAHYSVASAENTGHESDFFDLIIAGQCWHWFDHSKAINEVKRIGKHDARLVIAHFDWLPLNGSVAQATEKLIKQFNPDWCMDNGTGFYAEWAMQLAEAGLGNIETYSFTKKRYFTPESWRGRVRASAGVGGTLPAEQVEAFDQALEKMLSKDFPQEHLCINHRCFTLHADIHRPDSE